MNTNMKMMFLTILLPLCFTVLPTVYAQEENSYRISGEISGLKDGTVITLKSLEEKGSTARAKNGKFDFKGRVGLEGTPYILSIAGLEKTKELLLDNALELTLSGKLEDWPDCNAESTNFKGSYLDFQQRVQMPFSTAYQNYFTVMKSLTGKEGYQEWESAIKTSNGMDSLRMVLPREIYNTATQTYIKEVFLWIGRYPDSYFSPELIKRWWPKEDKSNAYNRLSQSVKESYYGKILYEQLKTVN